MRNTEHGPFGPVLGSGSEYNRKGEEKEKKGKRKGKERRKKKKEISNSRN